MPGANKLMFIFALKSISLHAFGVGSAPPEITSLSLPVRPSQVIWASRARQLENAPWRRKVLDMVSMLLGASRRWLQFSHRWPSGGSKKFSGFCTTGVFAKITPTPEFPKRCWRENERKR